MLSIDNSFRDCHHEMVISLMFPSNKQKYSDGKIKVRRTVVEACFDSSSILFSDVCFTFSTRPISTVIIASYKFMVVMCSLSTNFHHFPNNMWSVSVFKIGLKLCPIRYLGFANGEVRDDVHYGSGYLK